MDLFHFYQYFPIDDHSGQPVSDAEMVALQYGRLTQLQRLFFKYHPALRELALANCGTLQKRAVLKPALQALEPAELTRLVVKQLRCADSCLSRGSPTPAGTHVSWWTYTLQLMTLLSSVQEKRLVCASIMMSLLLIVSPAEHVNSQICNCYKCRYPGRSLRSALQSAKP